MELIRIEPLQGGDGRTHMEIDTNRFETLESSLRSGAQLSDCLPSLRLFTWDRPTVTLGRGQKPEVALAPRWESWSADPSADPHGPALVVQRPTGGRAVWHEQELTYSVVFPLEHPLFQRSGRSPEDLFGQWLLQSGRNAGIEGLALERGGTSRDPLGLGAAPCFASTSRNELRWLGEKWVGSARRVGQKALLQHGAIRLGPAGDNLETWLTGTTSKPDPRPWSILPSAEILAHALAQELASLMERHA